MSTVDMVEYLRKQARALAAELKEFPRDEPQDPKLKVGFLVGECNRLRAERYMRNGTARRPTAPTGD